MIRGVHAPGTRIDLLGQAIGVGGFEFAHAAVVENDARQGIIFGEFLQHIFAGGRLAGRGFAQHGDAEFVEENFLNLFRRAEIEGLTGAVVGALFQFLDAQREFAALLFQHGDVDGDAGAFHARQHRHQRHLQFVVEFLQGRQRLQLRPEVLMQSQRDVGILGGIRPGLLDGHLRERNLLGAFAGHIFVVNGGMAEVFQRQRVHVVTRCGAVQHIALQHGVVTDAAQDDAVIGEHAHVVFEILPELGLGGVFQQRAEFAAVSPHDPVAPAHRHSYGPGAHRPLYRRRWRRTRRRSRPACNRGWWSRCRRRTGRRRRVASATGRVVLR